VLGRLAERHEIDYLLTRPDRARGRGRRVTPTPAKEVAERLGIPVRQPERLGAGFEPGIETVVVVAYGLLVPSDALQRARWLNIHPSLLPRHRGPEPIYWTIANGDADAGITVHLTVPRIDAGPILAQRRTRVSKGETAGSLSKKLVAEGLAALDETLARLEAGNAEALAVDLAQGSYEPPVRRAELDWDQPLQQIDRLVRAGHPDQPPYFTYRGQRRYVYGVRPVNPDSVPLERLKRSHGTKGPLAWAGGPDGEMLAAVRDAVVAVRWLPVGHTHAVRPLAKQQFP